jgi:hypothetical protein
MAILAVCPEGFHGTTIVAIEDRRLSMGLRRQVEETDPGLSCDPEGDGGRLQSDDPP